MKKLMVLLTLFLMLSSPPAIASGIEVGAGVKFANDISRTTLFLGKSFAQRTLEGNLMLSDPQGIVTLWEMRFVPNEGLGPYVGVRATNASGHKLTIGPELGLGLALKGENWSTKGIVGIVKQDDVVYVWDASIQTVLYNDLGLEVGVQQNITWRTETWPRIALKLNF